MKRPKKGFTLVELLVVIAILAILASVSVVGYTAFIAKANQSVALQEMTQIRDALIAEDITNDAFNLSDGIDDATEAAAIQAAYSQLNLGLNGQFVAAATGCTYTINEATATWVPGEDITVA